MPDLFGKEFTKQELHSRIGHSSQVGGVQLARLEDGPSRGVRLLEFRTGSGLVFKVAVDRGMDIAWCDYRGASLAWVSPSGLPAPWFFDQTEGFGWLRTAMGGLINTCGLLHIGNPEEADVRHYQFPARQTLTYGVHDRAALIPACLISYGEYWDGDECYLEAVGELVQAQAFGENVKLTRRYQVKLGSSSIRIQDVVENIGFHPVTHMLLYHINVGFPFLDANTEFIAPLDLNCPPKALAGHGKVDDPITGPRWDAELEVFQYSFLSEADGSIPVALVNEDNHQGLYVVYDSNELPVFLQTRLMRAGMYMVCLEPCTNVFGRREFEAAGPESWLQPGEKREYSLEIGVLDGEKQLEDFKKRIHTIHRVP
jgi:hypothetical protein